MEIEIVRVLGALLTPGSSSVTSRKGGDEGRGGCAFPLAYDSMGLPGAIWSSGTLLSLLQVLAWGGVISGAVVCEQEE